MAIAYKNLLLVATAVATPTTIFLPQFAPLRVYSWALVLVVLMLLTCKFVWSAVLWPKLFSPIRSLPGPKDGHFLHGQFFRILREPTGNPARHWINDIPNEGLLAYTHIFNKERVLPTSAKALAEVLVHKNYDFRKPSELSETIGRLLGNGVLLAEGDEHKRQRKLLMPAFSFRHIKDLYPVFWSKARESVVIMTEAIQTASKQDCTDESEGSVLNVANWASRATLDIIGIAGMGHNFNAIRNPDSELNKCYRQVFTPSKGARLLWFLRLLFPLWIVALMPLRRNREILAARATIRRISADLIAEKRRKMEKEGSRSDLDVLSVAIESGGFTDEDLIDQLMTFLAAGHETTASALSWAVYLLCRNPDMQKRLRAEIQANLPSVANPDASVTAAEADKLPYLNAFVNETLRYIPSVPSTTRVANRDTSIIGQPIPRGTTVIICPWAVNHNKDLWGEDADIFNPERWIGPGRANSGGAESNYAFLTFLHGPRSCIGQGFAKSEFACLLAAWVGRFEMELEKKDYVVEYEGVLTARPKGGLRVRFRAVEVW